MASVQVVVRDRLLTEQVMPLLTGAGVAGVPHRDSATRLVLCDESGLAELGEGLRPPTVMVTDTPDGRLWQSAARAGVEQIVPLPYGADLLRDRLARLAAAAPRGRLVRVIGARGGCGASTLAVGLAVALQQQAATMLVDGDADGPGLELALGLGRTEGIRWADLADVRGHLPVSSLSGRLPAVGDLAVLSHRCVQDRDWTGAWTATVESLLQGFATVVADVPRTAVSRLPQVTGGRDVVLLPCDLGGVAYARHLLARLGPQDPALAVRSAAGPVRFGSVVRAFGGRSPVQVPTSRAIVGAADFGDLATVVSRGPFARSCRDLADRLTQPSRQRESA